MPERKQWYGGIVFNRCKFKQPSTLRDTQRNCFASLDGWRLDPGKGVALDIVFVFRVLKRLFHDHKKLRDILVFAMVVMDDQIVSNLTRHFVHSIRADL